MENSDEGVNFGVNDINGVVEDGDNLAATTVASLYATATANWTNTTADDYIYDYDPDALPPMEEFIPVTLLYTLTLLLGVIGNALVIFSIAKYRKMQSVTNIFLTSLASADMLLVLICVPVKVSILCLSSSFQFSFTSC